MELSDQFIQERVYLKGVSPKTVISYRCAFQAFSGATKSKPAMMQRIKELRERGISTNSVHRYLRDVKAYLRWMEQEGLRIPWEADQRSELMPITIPK
jgi:site-specific recombinase XerD